MKRIILPALMIAAALTFTSCNNATGNEGEMKEPKEKVANNENEKNEKDEKEEGKTIALRPETAKAKTIADMQAAFKGESNAYARYAAFAKKADEEGQKEIAALFRAASMAEGIHAQNHKEVLQEMGVEAIHVTPEVVVKSTKENLETAISGEAYEVKDMYPAFLKDADASDSKLAVISLTYAYKTEKKHEALYRKALEAFNAKTTSSLAEVFYVCPTCGNTVENAQPRRCDISMTKGDRFTKIV